MGGILERMGEDVEASRIDSSTWSFAMKEDWEMGQLLGGMCG